MSWRRSEGSRKRKGLSDTPKLARNGVRASWRWIGIGKSGLYPGRRSAAVRYGWSVRVAFPAGPA
jgi:hypothetical protein